MCRSGGHGENPSPQAGMYFDDVIYIRLFSYFLKFDSQKYFSILPETQAKNGPRGTARRKPRTGTYAPHPGFPMQRPRYLLWTSPIFSCILHIGSTPS